MFASKLRASERRNRNLRRSNIKAQQLVENDIMRKSRNSVKYNKLRENNAGILIGEPKTTSDWYGGGRRDFAGGES